MTQLHRYSSNVPEQNKSSDPDFGTLVIGGQCVCAGISSAFFASGSPTSSHMKSGGRASMLVTSIPPHLHKAFQTWVSRHVKYPTVPTCALSDSDQDHNAWRRMKFPPTKTLQSLRLLLKVTHKVTQSHTQNGISLEYLWVSPTG